MLDLLLEAKRGESRPPDPPGVELDSKTLAAWAGDYESTSYWARLKVEGNALVGELSGQPISLVPTAPNKLLASGRILFRAPLEFSAGESPNVTFTALVKSSRGLIRPRHPRSHRPGRPSRVAMGQHSSQS